MNNGPVRQINNFAKVIKVDAQGNPIRNDNNEVKEVIVPIKSELIIKEKNPYIVFYLVIILILIAILLAFISFYVLPRVI